MGVEARILRQVADARPNCLAVANAVQPEYLRCFGGGSAQAEQNRDGSCLPGTVWAEETDYGILRNGQVNTAECGGRTERLGQGCGLDGVWCVVYPSMSRRGLLVDFGSHSISLFVSFPKSSRK